MARAFSIYSFHRITFRDMNTSRVRMFLVYIPMYLYVFVPRARVAAIRAVYVCTRAGGEISATLVIASINRGQGSAY